MHWHSILRRSLLQLPADKGGQVTTGMNQTSNPQEWALLVEKMASFCTAQLKYKMIRSQKTLLKLFKQDLGNVIYGLHVIRHTPACLVLQTLFDSAPFVSEIAEALQGDKIYHFGFEVHEPLDLILYGFEHWIEKVRQAHGITLEVSRYLRFPASSAFQLRVGAPSEILRIWVVLEDSEFMLELFHIDSAERIGRERRFQDFWPRTFPEFTQRTSVSMKDTMQRFKADPIWHYALFVQTPEQVRHLHVRFQQLVLKEPTYLLPYRTPVENTGDGSLHTKLINQRRKLEVEFVTQQCPSIANYLTAADLSRFQFALRLELERCAVRTGKT